MGLTLLHIPYKWSHTVSGLLWLGTALELLFMSSWGSLLAAGYSQKHLRRVIKNQGLALVLTDASIEDAAVSTFRILLVFLYCGFFHFTFCPLCLRPRTVRINSSVYRLRFFFWIWAFISLKHPLPRWPCNVLGETSLKLTLLSLHPKAPHEVCHLKGHHRPLYITGLYTFFFFLSFLFFKI